VQETRGGISARVNRERVVLAGWSRAILLQVAHPLVAAGVAGHSSFRASPVASARRLHHTVRAMLGLAFGDAAARDKVLADIRAIHRRVHGALREAVGPFPAGTRYSAEDPALVLWVHVTLLDSVVLAYEALVAPLSRAERDAYCREAAGVATELGAREEDVPRDWPALERAMDAAFRSGAIVVGPDARAVADALLRGGFSRVTGPVAWANRLLTAGWLPPAIRTQYGLRWNVRRERRFRRLVAAVRHGLRLAPRLVREWAA
jgi:uncharacterized protein (DUF2236 family)